MQLPPAPPITVESSLWIYGPMGTMCVILLTAIGFLWRALARANERIEIERKEHMKQLDDARREFMKQLDDGRREFVAQLEILIERERQTSATMSSKYHSLAENLHLVLEKLENRLRGRVEGGG
jgi:hypothetical protein